MSPMTNLLWSLILCLFGVATWLFILQKLRRLQRLMDLSKLLRPGPVELWGTLRVRNPAQSSSSVGVLVYQQLLIREVLAPEDDHQLGVSTRCLVADCELETAAGRLPIDLRHCRVESFNLEYHEPMGEPVNLGSGVWLPSLPTSERPGAYLTYQLIEHSIPDGSPVLVLGDASELTWSGKIPAPPGFNLHGTDASPLLIYQGSRRHWLGIHLWWLIVLCVLGSVAFYQGGTMLQSLSLQW